MIRTALASFAVLAAVTVAGPAVAAEGCHEGTCTPPPCTAEGCVKPPKPCVVVEGVSCVEGKSKAVRKARALRSPAMMSPGARAY